jgi:hypothetical protein
MAISDARLSHTQVSGSEGSTWKGASVPVAGSKRQDVTVEFSSLMT